MVMSSPVYASPTTTLYVDPPSIKDTGLTPGKNFTINVNVANVTDLYGFDFFLNYTTAVLTATKITLGSFFPSNSKVWKKVINDALGYVRYLVSMPTGTPQGGGLNGSGTLAIISFTVDSYGASPLDLNNTLLGDSYAGYIAHEVHDGYFRNWIPGDGNLNGVVDMDDFYVWREYFGKSTGEWPPTVKPDYDSSGFVDMYDFYTWTEHFGESDP